MQRQFTISSSSPRVRSHTTKAVAVDGVDISRLWKDRPAYICGVEIGP